MDAKDGVRFKRSEDERLGFLNSLQSRGMQTEPAQRRTGSSRARRGDSGRTGRRAAVSCGRSPGEEAARFKEIIASVQRTETQTGSRGEEEERERGGGRGAQRGGRRAASEGGDGSGRSEESRRLRRRLNQLEREKLQVASCHNQELCGLQAELTLLRSSVEQGETQRAELQYQLTVSRRDGERAGELSRDKDTLTERAAELQHTVEELREALRITRRSREEDQHALQQEVEERDRLIESFSSENQRLHRLLQDQEATLEESERRMKEVQKEREREGELNRRQADELKHLMEREERSRQERELCGQRMKTLESSMEVERAAHLQSKFNSEIIQLRVRDLEAAVAAERSSQQEAQGSLELLRAQFREVERAYNMERERSDSTERALQRLQTECEQFKSDMSVALETERKATSDLSERLEEEKRRHANTHSLLEQAARGQRDREEDFVTCMKQIRGALQQHSATAARAPQPAKHDGKRSASAEVLQLLTSTLADDRQRQEDADRRVEDLQEENRSLRQLTSAQRSRLDESQQLALKLEGEAARLRQESCDWSTQSRGLQGELQREREARERDVQKLTERHREESEVHLSFLHCLYQRLLAGCVLLHQPHSILGNFTWRELCDVISEQVDQLTSDLQKANDKIVDLQSVCEKKSVRVRELQRSQECVLSRLEEGVRRREEAWSSQHAHTVTQLQSELQVCRSQCDSLRGHVSSLELRVSSLTSDLSRLQGVLSRSRREACCFSFACILLSGALRHAHRRLHTLCEQKRLLSRRLAARELLEEEVRRLTDALGGEKDEEEEERGRRRRAVRWWRRSVCAVLAARRWRALAGKTTVLFRLERGGGALAVCVCGESTTATQTGQDLPTTDKGDDDVGDEGREAVCARWLRSKRLSSAILSSMSDLQGALTRAGSSPPHVILAARSGLSRLLDHLLDQSETTLSSGRAGDDNTLSGRLRLGLSSRMPPQPDTKLLVSTLQQHFLLFSQRLHSAEVERRGLRLEVANLKRGLRQERKETCRAVPAERFHSVCAELRQALSREQDAQALIQLQSEQLHALQLRVDAHAAEQTDTQRTLSQNTEALSEARQEASRKERSLRILGKHLSGVQRERRQLEEKLQRAEEKLREATRRQECVISCMKAAETSCKQVRDSLVQSQRSQSAQPRPLQLPGEHLVFSGAESIMGAPEVAVCQTFLSVVAQLCHTCSSRIDWLEQEVSAHRSHVTALRGELQDACLRDNLSFVPVAEFPETFPFADVETPRTVPLSDLSKDPEVGVSPSPSPINPAPSSQPNPTLSSPVSTSSVAKTKQKKPTKKNRGHVKSRGKR